MPTKQEQMQERMTDKNYKGDDFLVDQDIENGPLNDRKCTDIICTMIFIAYVTVLLYIVRYSWANSEQDILLAPIDSDGKLCGVDYPEYDQMYYLMAKSGSMYPTCVKECPAEIDSIIQCMPTEEVKEGDCAQDKHTGYGTLMFFGRYCYPNVNKLPDGMDLSMFDNMIGSFGLDDLQDYYGAIVGAKHAYKWAMLMCVICALVFMLLIRYFAKPLVWTVIISVGVLLVFLALFMKSYHEDNFEGKEPHPYRAGVILYYSVYVVYVLIVLYFIGMCCLYSTIAACIEVLKVSSAVMLRNTRIMLVPFVTIFVQFLWVYTWIWQFSHLLSTGKITYPDNGSQFKSVEWTQDQKWLMYTSIFGFFWIYELISAASSFIMIVAICTWYFTCSNESRGNFSLSRGFWWTFRYNLGSLAFGSFILAVIWIIRIIFEYLQKQMEKASGDNAVVKVIGGCIRCCLDCFHRFVKFLNENAYIQVALTGENFCTSAMMAFTIAIKNAAYFFITNGIGMLISYLGRVFIALANVIICYILLTKVPFTKLDIDNIWPPLALVFWGSFIISSIIMSVYDSVSLTVLQCLFMDFDICDQKGKDKFRSANRPAEMDELIRRFRK